MRKRVRRPIAVLSTNRPSTRIEMPDDSLDGDVGCIARKENWYFIDRINGTYICKIMVLIQNESLLM